MKTLILFLFMTLLVTTLTAQNQLGLERNTEYRFQSATSWHLGRPVPHISSFNFKLDANFELWYWENDEVPCSMGKALFLKHYPGEEGNETYLYQCKDVRVEHSKDGTRVTLCVVYGNKRIVFHQEDIITASNTKRNK